MWDQVFCRNLRAESQFGIQSSMHLPFSPSWHSSLTISAGKLALEAESTQEMQLRVGSKRLELKKLSASRFIDLKTGAAATPASTIEKTR